MLHAEGTAYAKTLRENKTEILLLYYVQFATVLFFFFFLPNRVSLIFEFLKAMV